MKSRPCWVSACVGPFAPGELFDPGDQLLPVGAQQDGREDGDAERAAHLLGGVDHAGGLALVLLGNRGQPGRVVDGEHDAEADALEDQAGDQQRIGLRWRGQAEGDPGCGEDEEADHERRTAADLVEGAARRAGPARMIGTVAGIRARPATAGETPITSSR